MGQDQISLDGLPKPLARAIEAIVEMAHRMAGSVKRAPDATPRDLPRWEGRVLGDLSRREIYDDSR